MTSEITFEALPLAAPLQRALREKNYTTPSPIQAQAIPHLLEGHDLLGSAQTGTGKTAAFSLPILHQMHEDRWRVGRGQMRALILTPTRELAVQVGNAFREYGKHIKLSHALVYGGVGQGPQVSSLRRGVDVLVATPGRLLDLYNQGHVDFGAVEFFVLDEADRMLDMGFIHDIRKVVDELPEKRQSLFFSATLSEDITRLANEILTNPREVRVAPKETTAEKIDHRVCFLRNDNKMSLLTALIDEERAKEGVNLTLVFSRTKHGADRLARHLGKFGMRADAIHGNKSQNARQKALEKFRSGKAPILVATDVAARGIDVKGITLVVNYDVPNEPESYVHRIGRTARAGMEGRAFTFCTHENLGELRAIERLIRKEITLHDEHEFHDAGLAEKRNERRNGNSDKSRKGKGKGNWRGRPSGKRNNFRHRKGRPSKASA